MLYAGVVPFCRDASGKLRVLLGREQHGRQAGFWAAFTGGPERRDGGCAYAAAAREAHEESRGLLGSSRLLERLLRDYALRIDARSGTHFLLYYQYNEFLPAAFAGVCEAMANVARGDTRTPYFEKSEIRWFTMEELAQAVARDPRSPWQLRPGFIADWPLLRKALEDM